MKRTWNVVPVLQIVQKIIALAYIYQQTKFGDFMSCDSKDYSKMHVISYNDTHCDITDFINHGMVKNTKT